MLIPANSRNAAVRQWLSLVQFLFRPRRGVTPPLLALGLAITLALPWPAAAEDLSSLYRSALDNDPRYRAAEANRAALQERIPQARAGLLPQLSATASRNRNENEVVTDSTIVARPAGHAEYRSKEYALNLTQPVYNAAALAALRQAHAEARRGEAEYAAARQDLMLRLAEAYFQLLLAQDQLALADAEKTALALSLEAARARHKAGVTGITELNDARARYQLAAAQEVEAANQIEDRRQALREIVATMPAELSSLRADFPLVTPDPPDIQRWVDTALGQNLGLLAAKEAAAAAREDVARSRAGHLPTLNIVGSRTRNDADASIAGPGIRADDTVIGLQLSVPLLQGGYVSARGAEMAHRYTAALQEVEARRRAVERAARASFLGVRGAGVRVEALGEAVAASATALEAKSEGYRVGLYTAMDVLDATRDLYRAKRDHAEARYAFVLNLLRLKQAAGTLSEDDLTLVNNWLQ